MDLSKPYSGMSPGVEGDVLVVLAGSTPPRTGREVARLAGRSKTGVQAVLDRLAEEGLVHQEQAGRAHVYALNREHILGPAVELMAGARTDLFRRLRDAVGAWKIAPEHASVFGSAARGDGDRASDIDLFVVRPRDLDSADKEWRRQIDEIVRSIRDWTGNHAAISEVSVTEVDGLVRGNAPIVEALKVDAVELAGRGVRDLLGRP